VAVGHNILKKNKKRLTEIAKNGILPVIGHRPQKGGDMRFSFLDNLLIYPQAVSKPQ
jgi:hypothetical protein